MHGIPLFVIFFTLIKSENLFVLFSLFLSYLMHVISKTFYICNGIIRQFCEIFFVVLKILNFGLRKMFLMLKLSIFLKLMRATTSSMWILVKLINALLQK